MNTFNLTIIQHHILTEPEVSNYFSIYTQSDLSRLGKETIKKAISLIDG